MPPYDLMAIEHVVFAVGVGLAITLVVMLARGSRWLGFSLDKKSDAELEQDLVHFPGQVSESHRPVPWLIWLLWPLYLLWAAGYIIFHQVVGM